MKKESRCETAAKAYEAKKRMQKLAGISEQGGGVSPEFKEKVHALGDGIKKLTDILKNKTK